MGANMTYCNAASEVTCGALIVHIYTTWQVWKKIPYHHIITRGVLFKYSEL